MQKKYSCIKCIEIENWNFKVKAGSQKETEKTHRIQMMNEIMKLISRFHLQNILMRISSV